MDDKKLNLQEISSTMMQLFVQDVLNRNNITKETRKPLSDEQKEQIKKVVADLQAQVEEYVKGTKKTEEDVPKAEETTKNTTLRDMLKKRKNDN
ncbi:hypothetical protein [Metabacillus niabensis]|uniref:Spore coat protein W n=1 Tax=Metabacillus niabensis TaxID=324854 RepID=A0ABT9YVW1_9BACI|nr:hypothetical protein [Metabacillus niabensis]MDQ0224126.1 spore coat protein W [Metabacillus niabensis]PAD70345.1 hypothetical protein CHH83_03210 [Bacillus sp. 7586-K]